MVFIPYRNVFICTTKHLFYAWAPFILYTKSRAPKLTAISIWVAHWKFKKLKCYDRIDPISSTTNMKRYSRRFISVPVIWLTFYERCDINRISRINGQKWQSQQLIRSIGCRLKVSIEFMYCSHQKWNLWHGREKYNPIRVRDQMFHSKLININLFGLKVSYQGIIYDAQNECSIFWVTIPLYTITQF